MTDKLHRLTIRIPPGHAKAAKRFCLEQGIPFTRLMALLIKQGIPDEYWKAPTKEVQ